VNEIHQIVCAIIFYVDEHNRLSCPRLSRASSLQRAYAKDVDGRNKSGHDDVIAWATRAGLLRRYRSSQ
jgi:hypothetical protein